MCEPITAEGRGQGAAEDEEKAGPGDHDENDEDAVRECVSMLAAEFRLLFYKQETEILKRKSVFHFPSWAKVPSDR